jgi:transcription elongation factor GreA
VTTPDTAENQLITAAGHSQLLAELAALTGDGRRLLAERLHDSRADGHLADNPALFELLEEQAQLERRISLLETQLASARVAPPPADGVAGVGSFVRVRDVSTREEAVYELVGSIETDVGNGRVSIDSPVGQALVGSRAGEQVTVTTPRGATTLAIAGVDEQVARAA